MVIRQFHCDLCDKDVDNEVNFKRHKQSKEHLGNLMNKPAVADPQRPVLPMREGGYPVPVPVRVPPTPMGGALSVFTAPQKLTPEIAKEMGIPWTPTAMPAVITTPSVPALQPLQPINWKKWAIIGGLVVGGLVLVDRAMTKPRVIYQPTQSIMPAAPAGHGGLGALIPPAAAGILGWLLVSKLLRTEVAGWTKASKDFFKEWAG